MSRDHWPVVLNESFARIPTPQTSKVPMYCSIFYSFPRVCPLTGLDILQVSGLSPRTMAGATVMPREIGSWMWRWLQLNWLKVGNALMGCPHGPPSWDSASQGVASAARIANLWPRKKLGTITFSLRVLSTPLKLDVFFFTEMARMVLVTTRSGLNTFYHSFKIHSKSLGFI